MPVTLTRYFLKATPASFGNFFFSHPTKKAVWMPRSHAVGGMEEAEVGGKGFSEGLVTGPQRVGRKRWAYRMTSG